MIRGNTNVPVPTVDKKELNERIAELWNAGETAGQIAATLSVTRNNVMGRVWRAKRRGEKLR